MCCIFFFFGKKHTFICISRKKALSLQQIKCFMDIALLIIAGILMLIGIIGSIIPGIPGPPVSYAGLWIAQITERVDFPWHILLIWGIVTVIVTILDYVVPALGTKKFGGTKYGAWGSTIGVFVGMLFGALGIILGPLVGAIIGESFAGKPFRQAVKAGWGSFIGIMCGTLIKLICCGLMLVYLIIYIW